MSLPAPLKAEVSTLLDDLPLEALPELRQFIHFLKFKAQLAPASPPVAIGGWLAEYRFSVEDIAEARAEMWGRFQAEAA